MRLRTARITIAALTALIIVSCSKRATVTTTASLEINSGNCAGCLLNTEERVFSFVVRTDADYESLAENCLPKRTREEGLPPRPAAEEDLVYVSLRGSGCEGCLDIVNIRESSSNIVVDVEGGFHGGCEMLIVRGAWALLPETDKTVTFQLHEVVCPDSL